MLVSLYVVRLPMRGGQSNMRLRASYAGEIRQDGSTYA